MLLGEDPPSRANPRRRALIFLSSLAATGLAAALALSLGSWGYRHRLWRFHQDRLAKLLTQKPQADAVTAALELEGAQLVARTVARSEMAALAASSPPEARATLSEKAARTHELRVFGLGEVRYFLYFDAEGRMRDFACLLEP